MLFRNVSIKYLLLFLFSLPLLASENDSDITHPFYLLKAGEIKLSVESSYFLEEHEYEKAKVVQDLFEYKHYLSEIHAAFGLKDDRLIGGGFLFLHDGALEKSYSPSLNIPRSSVHYKGPHAFLLFYQEHFKTENDKNKLALEIRFKGSPIKGKETNNTYSGKDVSLGLLYSHRHENWRYFGSLRSDIIGRKKTTKDNGELETVNAYSQFGTELGAQWLSDKFWLEGAAKFYLTTDYNSHSLSYTRLTDKGFVVGGKFLVGYFLNDKTTLTVEHVRQGSNFNVIADSTTEATEFEIETQYTKLGVAWVF